MAFSYAGTDRELVRGIVAVVEAAGYSAFFDVQREVALWGENLADVLDRVYREQSDFCVVVASNEYAEREWTQHELRSAVARVIKEKGAAYLLQIRIDPVTLPGVQPTIGYIDLADRTPEDLGAMLVKKLRAAGILPDS